MIATFALTAFLLTGVCGIVRLFRGPTLADRVVALDLALVCLMGAVAVDAISTGDPTALPAMVVVSIVGFTATVAAARFIERQRVVT